jgi:hypothetical protein
MKQNRTTTRDRCRNATAGIDKHLASEKTIPLDGAEVAPADIKKAFTSLIAFADASVAAKGQLTVAVQAERASRTHVLAWLDALKSYCILKFGKGAVDTLADFGFAPPKTGKKKVATKAIAATKAAATRKARSTMGSRQKAKVKGTVTPVDTSHGVTSGPTTAAPATPAK